MANSNRMIARHSPKNGLDDFPTPPWATRALTEFLLPNMGLTLKGRSVLEPACGRGHMMRTLREAGLSRLDGYDIKNYGKPALPVKDFLEKTAHIGNYDWVITNPPYKAADDFFYRSRLIAKRGVALLVRMNWLQGNGRWERIFSPDAHPPSIVGIFASRIPFAKGRVVQEASVFFQHVWCVWVLDKRNRAQLDHTGTRVLWIPPETQAQLERSEDYKR